MKISNFRHAQRPQWVLWIALLGVSFLVSTMSFSDDTKRLVLTGSSTIAPLAEEIGKRFEKQNPGWRIDVQTGGSSRGVADTRKGLANVGMASRGLKSNETDLVASTIAWDGISLLVHADNPVQMLSKQQVRDLFTGKIRNWQAVGGPDKKVVVIDRAAGRSEPELFYKYFDLAAKAVQPSLIVGENAQGIKSVAGNPAAITYLSVGHAVWERGAGVPIRVLPIDGIQPTFANINSGVFPMARPLNLLTVGKPRGDAARFIRFAQAAKNHDLVKQQSFVPVSGQPLN